jgi:hypothetical protein
MRSYSAPTNFSNAAQFYPDATGELGGFTKSPMAQTLVTLDYANMVVGGNYIIKVAYILDVQTTPLLIISNSTIINTASDNLMTFIISGGWSGITYNLSVQTTWFNGEVRTHVLQIEVMGNDMRYDPCFPQSRAIVPCSIPKSYQQAILSSDCSSYKSACITYYICDTPPVNPNVMDQWYNTVNHTVQEYLTDGVTFWWQPFQVAVASQAFSLYYIATAGQVTFVTTTPDMNGKSAIIADGDFVNAYVNGVRLAPETAANNFGGDYGYLSASQGSVVGFKRAIPAGYVVMIDIVKPPTP